jgi:hypothetical protein
VLTTASKARFDRCPSPASDTYLAKLALYQLTEQHLGILQERRVKAFGEPVMDRREEIACFGHGVGDGPGAIAAVVCAQR